MILKGNSRTTALVGGIFTFRKNTCQYEESRASVVFGNGIIQKIYPFLKKEEALSAIRKDFGDDVLIVHLDDNCHVFPGLVDLHNHIDYNMMPIWTRPIPQPWDNRHEWRHANCFEYNREIKEFHRFIFANWPVPTDSAKNVYELLQFFSELQAVAGGTTVLQEPADISDPAGTYSASHLLLRSTGVSRDLGLEAHQKVSSIIDFFKPVLDAKKTYYPPLDTTTWELMEVVNKESGKAYFREYLDLLQKPVDEIQKTTGGFLLHLAEGRAGHLLTRKGIDAYSRKEFEYLKNHIKRIPDYAKKVTASRLTLIHGCGIDLTNPEDIAFINNCNIRVVWSPVSNLLLYDDTPKYLLSRIKPELICIGSDWAPSGSKHVWDECSFAQQFALKHIFKGRIPGNMYDAFLEMMSFNPAQALNSKMIGEIKVGKFADFYIVSKNRKVPAQLDTINNIFVFSDYHSVGTIIDGNLVFGVKELFDRFGQSGVSIAADGQYAANLMVHVPPSLNIDFDRDLRILDGLFGKYSRLIGKKFARSKFLSANDGLYRAQIFGLIRRFC